MRGGASARVPDELIYISEPEVKHQPGPQGGYGQTHPRDQLVGDPPLPLPEGSLPHCVNGSKQALKLAEREAGCSGPVSCEQGWSGDRSGCEFEETYGRRCSDFLLAWVNRQCCWSCGVL